MRKSIRATVEAFLRNAGRIISVIVYTTATTELTPQKMTRLRHSFKEYTNPAHRFDRTKNWALFRDYKVPKEWGGAHPKWVRVFSQGFIMRDQ